MQKRAEQPPNAEGTTAPPNLHIYRDEETIRNFIEGYKTDKEFAPMITRTAKEQQDRRKHQAYRLSDKGLLYFQDTGHKA